MVPKPAEAKGLEGRMRWGGGVAEEADRRDIQDVGVKEPQGQDGSSCVGVRAPDVGIGFQKGGGGTLSEKEEVTRLQSQRIRTDLEEGGRR